MRRGSFLGSFEEEEEAAEEKEFQKLILSI